MAQAVKVGGFIYRINPNDNREMQRCSIGASSWSRIAYFDGYHILDLLIDSNGKDILVYTDRYLYVREYNGNIRVRQ